jgi:hypothetical protein
MNLKLITLKMKYTILLLIGLFFGSCNQTEKSNKEVEVEPVKPEFQFGVWTTANKEKSNEDYTAEFKKYRGGGIDEVLINTNTDPELLKRLVPLAVKEGLKVHAWIMTMNRPGDSIALQHPDWYMVSRSGKSCFNERPYVEYYQ